MFYGNIGNAGERRGLGFELLNKFGNAAALDLDYDAVGVIGHIPGESKTAREVINVGPEPHALDNAFDYDLSPLSHWAQESIPAPVAQETSNILRLGLSARESFLTFLISVFM